MTIGSIVREKTTDARGNASMTQQNDVGSQNKQYVVHGDYTAKDPFPPGFATPEVNVHTNISVIENKKNRTLDVIANIFGDSFPSTEAFIQDASGKNSVFIGASMERGGLLDLVDDNNKPLISNAFQISFDKKGNFTGVKQGDKSYTIKEWNAQFTQKK